MPHPEVEMGQASLAEMERSIQQFDIPQRQQAPVILLLPPHFRLLDESAFEPQLVSIGPYHQGKSRLKLMEERKWAYLHRLVRRFPYCGGIKPYGSKAQSLVSEARKCYRDQLGSTMLDDVRFALMLVLDGSFILESLFVTLYDDGETNPTCVVPRDPVPVMHSNYSAPWARAPIAFDLIKLENQIPFFVLKDLYTHLCTDTQRMPANARNTPPPPINDLVLHYFKRVCIQIPSLSFTPIDTSKHHLLHFAHLCVYNPPSEPENSPTLAIPWIPTACGLQEAGIKFRSKETGRLLEVAFANGVLEMSPLVIDDRTSTLLHNLLAFEQYHPEAGDYVTSYCTFIGCLIDSAADVLLLRKAKILTNHIGSDEQLARLINSLPKNLGEKKFRLSKLFRDINQHYDSKWPKYKAKFMRDYCGSPWAMISVVAATVLLLLTAGQTLYTVLSFYHDN